MSDMILQFHQHSLNQLQAIVEHESQNIRDAAQAVADSIMNERDFLTFGSGHSELVGKSVV